MDKELLATFLAEAAAFLEETEEGLLALEERGEDPEILRTIFRHVHSLKGSAGYFGFEALVQVVHAMESALEGVRRGTAAFSPALVEPLLLATDFLRRMVAHPENMETMDPTPVLVALDPGLGTETEVVPEENPAAPSPIAQARSQGKRLFALALERLTELSPLGLSQVAFLKRLDQAGTVLAPEDDDPELAGLSGLSPDDLLYAAEAPGPELASRLGIPPEWLRELTLPSAPEAPAPGTPPAPELSQSSGAPSGRDHGIDDTVRIRVALLDDLLNLAGEMVLARNALFREMGRGAEGLQRRTTPPPGEEFSPCDTPALREPGPLRDKPRRRASGMERALGRIDLLTTEFREKIMQARLQPLERLFSRMPRLVRDLSRSLGKNVRLVLEGGEVELDRSLLEALGDPLVHLVRNALDHGVELPEARLAAGKPPVGTLALRAWSRGGRVYLDISDDGRGLDLDRIRARALERGLVSDREARRMVPDDLARFIFHPGFSTAASVTDISGRGVGMDVVLHNVESLGGTVDLRTTAGGGTTFRLSLPLTLAVLPSLLVACGEHRFALPQAHVEEALRLRPAEQLRVLSSLGDARILRLRDSVIPAVILKELLVQGHDGSPMPPPGGPSEEAAPLRKDGPRERPLPPTPHLLVLRAGESVFALGVDRILGSEEILVKPLPPRLKGCRIYGGATILGDGRIALILDPDGIASVARVAGTRATLDQRASQAWTLPRREERDLLLVRGPGNERFALDLSLVARIDEISTDAIQYAGGMAFATVRGAPVRLLPLEELLEELPPPGPPGKRFALELRFAQGPVAILVHAIVDALRLPMPSLAPNYPSPGAFGTFDTQGQLVVALDPFELLARAHPPVRPVPETLVERRILLLDDDPFGSRLEQRFLQGAGGCAVCRAEDLEGACATVERIDPHVILVTPRLATPDAPSRLRRTGRRAPAVALLTGSPRGAPPPGYDAELPRDDRNALLKGLARLCAEELPGAPDSHKGGPST